MTLIPHTKWEGKQKKEFQEKHTPFKEAVKQGVEKGYNFNEFSQDMFSSLYQINPKFPEEATSGAAWAKKALDELQSLKEFKQIRESGTKCDSFQSGLGASILTKHFADSLPKMEEKNPDEIHQEIKNLAAILEEIPSDSEKAKEFKDQLDKAKGSVESSQKAWSEMVDTLDPSAIRQALRKGLVAAQEAIDEAEGTANAFGYGTEPGKDGYASAQQKLAIAEKIRNNPKLKQIAEMAGRFRREARKQQANKKKPGPDEITDIECGNDLGRVVPSEMMLLNDEMGEMLFFKKYLERGLIQYKLEEAPHETRGPIVVCIDNSSSMMGVPEVWSKAVALAMAQIGIDQRRNVQLVHFNTEIAKIDVFPVGKIDPERLIDSCAFFSGGGTEFFPVLNKVCDIIRLFSKKSDIVFITDGIAALDDNMIEKLRADKARSEANIYSIVIGPKQENTVLHKISDSVDFISDFAEGNDKEIKEKVFSI